MTEAGGGHQFFLGHHLLVRGFRSKKKVKVSTQGKSSPICEGLLYHQLVRGFRSFWCSSVHTVVLSVRLDLSALL